MTGTKDIGTNKAVFRIHIDGPIDAVWKEMNDLDEVKALGYLLESMLPADVEGAEVLARQSQHPDGLVQFAKMCAHRDLEAAVKWG